MNVLIIEDDARLASLIKQVLEEEQMSAQIALDGETGLEYCLSGAYDVALVDWMLPGRDGPSICRAVRAAKIPIGILMLTARGQIEDRVTGLNMGADDYLVKPFSFDELVARVHAVSRRHLGFQSDPMELRVGDIVLDLKAHTARRAETTLDLTRTEWNILEYLLRHADQVCTRENILNYVWSHDREVQTTMVDVYISYLRAKIDLPKRKDPIQTIRGVGYKLESEHA